MAHQFLNIRKVNNKLYYVETDYNYYTIVLDEIKGCGVYMNYEGGNTLIKAYGSNNLLTAINHLIKANLL